MTSQRKIAANRSNSQLSSGPRTTEGKRKASGNARKHGWAALERRLPVASPDIEELAKALCGDERNPALLAQARMIATNELMRRAIKLETMRGIEAVLAAAKMSEDEYEDQAAKLANVDVNPPERYETRAWSRQKRALRNFIEISRSTET